MLICLSSTAYFSYHVLYGRYGLEARSVFAERAGLVEFEIRSLQTVRASLANDVALLSASPPDPDIVEELSREILGFVHPDDRLILSR